MTTQTPTVRFVLHNTAVVTYLMYGMVSQDEYHRTRTVGYRTIRGGVNVQVWFAHSYRLYKCGTMRERS